MNIQKIMNISLSFVPNQVHSIGPQWKRVRATLNSQPMIGLHWHQWEDCVLAYDVICRGPSCNVNRVEFLIDFEGWSLLRMWTDLYFLLDRPLVDVPVKELPNHANTFYFQMNRHWLSSVGAIWPSRLAALYGRASWTLMKWNSCPKINCKYRSN